MASARLSISHERASPRAAFRDTTSEITPRDLGLEDRFEAGSEGGTFKERVRAYEKRLILTAMDEANGNQAKAARSLGLPYHQFRYHYGRLREA